MSFTKSNLQDQIASLKEHLQLKRSLKSKTARQTGILYASQLLVMFLGLVTAPIVTRALGPEQFGVLSFTLAVIGFMALFFEFGFFSAGARLLALAKEEQTERELIGALTLITAGISISFSITIFIFSFFVDGIFKTQISGILRFIAIFVAIYPFRYMLQQVCQGANRIEKMALQNVAPRLWYLVGLLILISLFRLNVIAALLLNLTGVITATSVIIWSLRPRFGNLVNHTRAIWKETKEYGIHTYVGRLAGQTTYQLDKMFIAYFVETTSVGFYSLAMTLSSPIVTFTRSLSTSLFKGFTAKDRIPKRVHQVSFLWAILAAAFLILLGKKIILVLFTEKYLPVFPILIVFALTSVFHSLIQPLNMFLGAKGMGRFLKRQSFIACILNVFGNILFIPPYGAIGAAYASLFSMTIKYFVHLYYYRKTVNFINKEIL